MMTVYEFTSRGQTGNFRTECEDVSSSETKLHSSDDLHIRQKRTSDTKQFNQQEIKISLEPILCQKTKQKFLLLD